MSTFPPHYRFVFSHFFLLLVFIDSFDPSTADSPSAAHPLRFVFLSVLVVLLSAIVSHTQTLGQNMVLVYLTPVPF